MSTFNSSLYSNRLILHPAFFFTSISTTLPFLFVFAQHHNRNLNPISSSHFYDPRRLFMAPAAPVTFIWLVYG